MTEELKITNVLVNDSLTVNELNTLIGLFMMTNKRYVMTKLNGWNKYDVSDYRAKEIICTYKHYFLKGIKDSDPRITWVKHHNHIITRALRYLCSRPKLKFEYNREHESLFVFREKKVLTFNFSFSKKY
jgi:hypothetical protein